MLLVLCSALFHARLNSQYCMNIIKFQWIKIVFTCHHANLLSSMLPKVKFLVIHVTMCVVFNIKSYVAFLFSNSY